MGVEPKFSDTVSGAMNTAGQVGSVRSVVAFGEIGDGFPKIHTFVLFSSARKSIILGASTTYARRHACTFDLWARSNKSTPLVMLIHGGGFSQGSKENAPAAFVSALPASQ
jgi:hypothetical protein